MPKAKKNEVVEAEFVAEKEEITVENTGVRAESSNQSEEKRSALEALLKKKTPGIFEREPNSGFNSHLTKLVDDIIKLFN